MSGSSVVEDRSRARRAKSALAGELRWERVLPSLAAGWIVGLMQLVLALSLGALIFAGEPPHFLAAGIGLALLASIIAGVITSLFTSLPGAVAGVQDVPAAILALIAASLLRNLPPDAGATEKFVTVAAVMGLSALLTGLFFWILGRFRLGRLVRFLPYPVVGGFLAATGWLLATGAIGLMSGAPFGTASFQPQLLLRWLPGLLIAVVLFVVLNRSDHALAIPATLAAATGLFFTTALFSGTTPGELSAAGWLLGPFPDGGLWQPLLPADLGSVRWEAVGGSAISIAAILLMSAVGLLLNGTGLEIATRRDVDLNRELKLAGVANMISGLAGGLVTYHLLSVSMISFKLKAANRLTGLVGAGVCALALTVGASGLALFPRAVLGGLLLFLGLSFLKEWVVDAWFRLPRGDYFVVILILLLAAAMGFLEAVGLGIVAAVVLFVINYSRTDVVRHKLSGASQQSRVKSCLSCGCKGTFSSALRTTCWTPSGKGLPITICRRHATLSSTSAG
jgi:SulP family sulfate permease